MCRCQNAKMGHILYFWNKNYWTITKFSVKLKFREELPIVFPSVPAMTPRGDEKGSAPCYSDCNMVIVCVYVSVFR